MKGINNIINNDLDKNSTFPEKKREPKQYTDILKEILSKINLIDFHEKSNRDDDKGIPEKIYRVISIEELEKICNANGYGIGYYNGTPYIYTGEYWRPIDEKLFMSDFLCNSSLKMGVPEYTAKPAEYLKALLEQAKSSLHKQKPENQEKLMINLLNGTYEFDHKKSKLREFRKEDFMTYQLPFEYDENAQSPMFLKYLEEVLPDKSKQKVLAEFLGYIFMKKGNPHVKKLEKALFLYGGGANGKSVIFEIINALLGKENISTIKLEDLAKENFRAEIENKLLNYASEIGRTFDTSTFKTLASGETVTARKLYNDPFNMENYAKLMFNVNELPITSDKSNGFYRRFLIIHFDQTIPKEKRDTELSNKIIENELSGVFNWILEGMRRLYAQKDFTHSEAIESTLEMFKITSDNVSLFLEENEMKPCTENYENGNELYSRYKDFCIQSGHRPLGSRNFYNRLEDLGFMKARKSEGTVFYLKESKPEVIF